MDIRQKLVDLVGQQLNGTPHFLVEVVVSLRREPVKLMVIIDGDQGVTIDDCAKVSRAVTERVNTENWIDGNYNLEVTTPGLDHPLKLERQYYKNVGRGVKMTLKGGEVVQGKLTAFADGMATVLAEKKEGKKVETSQRLIPIGEIEKTIITVSFK